MNNNNNLKNIFASLENSLISNMNIRIQHNLEDGKYREYLVKEVLEKIIPSKYSITNGFVIDSNNKQSDEMDIIIYDRNYVPPFFDETYTVVPIESVIAVIQVKTKLTRAQLKLALDNLNSIDRLESKTGGKIISATTCLEVVEKRHIMPYKIIIAKDGAINKKYDFKKEFETLDIIYVVDKNSALFIKSKPICAVVNEDREKLRNCQNKDIKINIIKDNKLCSFSLYLLEKLKLINNSIIINYEEYIKGATRWVKIQR